MGFSSSSKKKYFNSEGQAEQLTVLSSAVATPGWVDHVSFALRVIYSKCLASP